MPPDLQQFPTGSLLHRTLRESKRFWAEHSRDERKKRALVLQTRELLMRLWQKKCAFAHDRLGRSLCSYDERLENMGCAHPEVDEGEGPEILSAAGFILRDLGLMSDDDRIAAVAVVMEARNALQFLDFAAQRGRLELPTLSEGQGMAMARKEAERRAFLGKIEEFLRESA